MQQIPAIRQNRSRRLRNSSPAIHREDYLLVDGCNIIFAWEDLRDLAQADFHAAQSRLMDILSDYQGIKGCILILVFDAYRVEGHPRKPSSIITFMLSTQKKRKQQTSILNVLSIKSDGSIM